MKNLIIAGAGGFGREVLSYALTLEKYQNEWRVKGFINDIREALDNFPKVQYPIINTIVDYNPQEKDVFIVAIGDPAGKRKVCNHLEKKNVQFINLIHPTAIIGERVKMGKGIIMAPYAVVSPDVIIEDFVTINSYSGAGHDSTIGQGTTLSSHVDITGNCKIGENVFIGSSVSITPHRKIGNHVKISAGSIVFTNIKDGMTVYGNPARQLK